MSNNPCSCAVTGHRKLVPPGYVGNGWWTPVCNNVQRYHITIQQNIVTEVVNLYQRRVTEFISGGAIGADILFAETIIQLRDMYHYPITLGIAKPFPSQYINWSQQTILRYNQVLSLADWVYSVSPDPYSPPKMQLKNEWMVDRAGTLIALWNGVTKGGTWNCIKYARSQGRKILTINV